MDLSLLRTQIETELADRLGTYTLANAATTPACSVRREGEGLFPGTRVEGLECVIYAEPRLVPVPAYRDQSPRYEWSVFLIGWDENADLQGAGEGLIGAFPGSVYERIPVPEGVGPANQARVVIQSYRSLVNALLARIGSFGVTGADIAIEIVSSSGIVAEAGSLALVGNGSTLVWLRGVVAEGGEYTVVGSDVGVSVARNVTAGAGSFAVTGNDAALVALSGIAAGAGSFAVTGNDISVAVAIGVASGAGSFAVTGNDAILSLINGLDAAAGSFAVTGAGVSLQVSYGMTAAAGTFAVSGNAAVFVMDYPYEAGVYEAGVYVLP